jgi:hypothetical protein
MFLNNNVEESGPGLFKVGLLFIYMKGVRKFLNYSSKIAGLLAENRTQYEAIVPTTRM